MVIVLAMTNLPYIWGVSLAPEGQIYAGLIHTYSDVLTYLAKMRQGYEGHWLYAGRYTTEPHKPALLFFFYILLGHLARWSGLSLILVYHLVRVGCGLMLMFAFDGLVKLLGFKGITRILAFTFAFTAGGFGWLVRLLRPDFEPSDFWWTEAYAFHSMMNFPHFAISSALILWALADLYRFGNPTQVSRGQQNGVPLSRTWGSSPWILARLSLAMFILAWVHPRLLLPVLVIGGATAVAGSLRGEWPLRRWIPGIVCAAVAGGLPALAIFLSYRGDPVWEQWAATRTTSPSPLWFLESFGLLWPLAIYGAWQGIRRKRPWGTFMAAWLITGSLLPYLPIPAQRRLVQGFNLVLSLLAASALGDDLLVRLRAKRILGPAGSQAVAFLVPVFLALSTLTYLGWTTGQIRHVGFPWYYSRTRAEAMAWLNRETARDDVVLCSTVTAQLIPALAGNRIVAGHWAETLNWGEKLDEIEEFFDAETPRERRRQIVEFYDVRYLLFGQRERDLGDYDPARDPALWRPAWTSPALMIYERVE